MMKRAHEARLRGSRCIRRPPRTASSAPSPAAAGSTKRAAKRPPAYGRTTAVPTSVASSRASRPAVAIIAHGTGPSKPLNVAARVASCRRV